MSENKEMVNLSEEDALKELEKSYAEAEEVLKDNDKIERLLQRLEKKLKVIPVVGEALSDIPVFASLLRSYAKKEYTDIPIGSMIAIVGALMYFVSPVDLIPDFVPFAGYVDDGLVVAACLKLVESDIKEYISWREKNGKTIEF